jgi:hypothetical protein
MLARMAAVRPLRALPTKSEFYRLSTMRFISHSDVVVDGCRAISREDVQLLPLSQGIVDRFGQALGSTHLQAHLHTPLSDLPFAFPSHCVPVRQVAMWCAVALNADIGRASPLGAFLNRANLAFSSRLIKEDF